MSAWSACLAGLVCVAAGCGPSEPGQVDAQGFSTVDAPVIVRPDARAASPDARAGLADARATSDAMAVRDAPVGAADAPPPSFDAPLGVTDAPSTPGDASRGPTIAFQPSELYVSRGGTASVRLVLPAEAGADTVVGLATTTTGASVPTSVMVPEGTTGADLLVTGVTIGAVSVTATVGNAQGTALVHVVPAIAAVVPVGPIDVLEGTVTTYTVTLDEAPAIPVPIRISVDDPAVVEADPSIVIAAGATSGQWNATATGLGVTTLHAAIGDDGMPVRERVNGLFLSEILYDPSGFDGGLEWIELKNATLADVVLDDMHIYAATSPPFVNVANLSGTIPAGTCAAITMPGAAGTDGILGNGSSGDGIRLVVGADQVIDEVIYGPDTNNDMIPDNGDQIPDENDLVAATADVKDVSSGDTIARDFSLEGMPGGTPGAATQGDCTNFPP